MKPFILCAFFAACVSPAFSRVGETENQLIKRFGQPVSTRAAGSSGSEFLSEFGPSMTFSFGDWIVTCDLIDGLCARIFYSKIGAWTEDNFQSILAGNAQGGKWTDLLSPNVKQLTRKWKRDDGVMAHWVVGTLSIVSPLYERARALAEEKARIASRAGEGVAAF